MSQSTTKNPQVIKSKSKSNQKSLVILQIKPADEKVDLKKIKQKIDNEIKMEGLIWGQYKIQQIGYGISKLVHSLVITRQISAEEIIQKIQKMEGVQAVDTIAFQKI